MADVVQILVLGLALGGVFALMGSGLSLVFGVMRIVNLAHPALIIGGAYVAYWGFKLWGVDPMMTLPVAALILAATGIVLYKLVFEREARSAKYSEMTVLLTFATAMVVEGALGTTFTNTQHRPQFCPFHWIFRNQRGGRKHLIQVFHDHRAINDGLAVVDQGWHHAIWIDGKILRLELIAAKQVQEYLIERLPLGVQRIAHTLRTGGLRRVVQGKIVHLSPSSKRAAVCPFLPAFRRCPEGRRSGPQP